MRANEMLRTGVSAAGVISASGDEKSKLSSPYLSGGTPASRAAARTISIKDCGPQHKTVLSARPGARLFSNPADGREAPGPLVMIGT